MFEAPNLLRLRTPGPGQKKQVQIEVHELRRGAPQLSSSMSPEDDVDNEPVCDQIFNDGDVLPLPCDQGNLIFRFVDDA